MQQLQIPTATNDLLDTAKNFILNRSLLYDSDKKDLYVKYNDELNVIGAKVDNDNIIFNENNEVALNDDIHCKTATVIPDDSGLKYKANIIFAETNSERKIILLSKISNVAGSISGMLYELGSSYSGSYHFSLSSSGSRSLNGSAFGNKATYVRVTYLDEDYIGIRFQNSNSTIYFSGYDLRNENTPPKYTTYKDSDYTKIIDLVDDSSNKSVTITYENKYNITWDFKDLIENLDENNKTTPSVQYSLTNGLFINGDFTGYVTFYPDKTVNGDKGYIESSGEGKFLKINLTNYKPILKVIFSSSADDNKERTLAVWDSNGNIIAQGNSTSCDELSILKTDILTQNSTYYIGATTSNIRIYKILLIYTNVTVTQEGHDKIEYDWEFISDMGGSNWTVGETSDLKNGLYIKRYSGYNWYSQTLNGYWSDKTIWYSTYYNSNPSLSSYIFILNVAYDNSTFTMNISSHNSNNSRTVYLLDSDGNTIASKTTTRDASWSYTIDTLSTNLNKGTYYICQSGPLNFHKMTLTCEAVEEIIEENDDQINDIIKIIDGLEETGENGDPHYLKIEDLDLSLSELKSIAADLRNSDKQIHLDLSTCTVKDDATSWEGLFNKCTSLIYFGMPQGVTNIGSDTFTGCIFLEQIKMCDSITTFSAGSNAYIFSGNRIRTYVLPINCKSIGWNTFANSGARNIIVPPDSVNTFHSMLQYGSFFNTLDYIRIYMTQTEYDKADYTLTWEHENYIGDTVDNTISAHIKIYSDLNTLLKSLNYEVD